MTGDVGKVLHSAAWSHYAAGDLGTAHGVCLLLWGGYGARRVPTTL